MPEDRERNDRSIVRADPRVRRRALLAILIVVVLGLAGYVFLTGVLADLDELSAYAPDLAAERAARVLEASVAITAALALIMAAWLARFATRILEAGRYPLPQARLTRDTRLRTGQDARRIAWLAYCCAAALALAAVGLLVTGWKVIAMLAPDAVPSG